MNLDFCPECIEQASYSALCEGFANKTSLSVGDICDIVCEAFGIDEFVNALVKANFDTIYYCEIVDLCPINDHGDAKLFDITPKSVPEGSTFVFNYSFVSLNGTGTRTIVIDFVNPKNRTISNLY